MCRDCEKNIGNVFVRGWWGERFEKDRPEQLNRILDLKREGAGPGYFPALDPDVEAVGVEVFRRYADENDMALMLGIDATVVSKGPVDRIAERVKRYILEGGKKGKLLLFLNDIPKETPAGHIHGAIQAAKLYGTYPLACGQCEKKFEMPEFCSFEEFRRKCTG